MFYWDLWITKVLKNWRKTLIMMSGLSTVLSIFSRIIDELSKIVSGLYQITEIGRMKANASKSVTVIQ